jgi:hypothetical protein
VLFVAERWTIMTADCHMTQPWFPVYTHDG